MSITQPLRVAPPPPAAWTVLVVPETRRCLPLCSVSRLWVWGGIRRYSGWPEMRPGVPAAPGVSFIHVCCRGLWVQLCVWGFCPSVGVSGQQGLDDLSAHPDGTPSPQCRVPHSISLHLCIHKFRQLWSVVGHHRSGPRNDLVLTPGPPTPPPKKNPLALCRPLCCYKGLVFFLFGHG